MALGFVLLVWTSLNLLTFLKNKPNLAGRSLISLGFSIVLIFLFSLHKFNLANSTFSAQLKQVAPWFPAEILLPFFVTLSFSYIFVRCIDLAHSCIWKNKPLIDPISLMGYLMPLHMLVSGPVNIYDDHMQANEKSSPQMTPSRVLLVINEITTGLFYKFVLAEGIRLYFYGNAGNISATEWFDPSVLVVYIFFDFAGYSKIARGMGLLYGIPTPENFNAPFLATSITEFFTRWHMSMGQFIKRNIFIPIQLSLLRKFGAKCASVSGVISMVISFGFVGLWHGLSWTWLLWGFALGTLIAGENFMLKLLIKNKWNQIGNAKVILNGLGRVYVFLVCTLTVYLFVEEVFP